MKIETVKIDLLSLDPANARKHDDRNMETIVGSLRRFGQQTPLVVDKSNVVRAGNARLEAAKRIGWDTIQIVRTELTSSDAVAYAIADNRTSELAEWDDDILAAQLQGLLTEDEALLDAAGFDEDELAELLGELDGDGTTGEIIEDEVPEPPVDPITKSGDLWILGRHRVLCGDSTKAEDVARLMGGVKADLCFTSPPYNLGKSVGLRNGARKGKASAYNDTADAGGGWADLMRSFLSLALKRSECVVCNVQLLSGNKFDLLSLLGEHATKTVDIAIWVKSNPQPAMAEGVMTSAFEFVWMLSSEDNPNRRIKTASFSRGTFSNVFESATASGHDASVHGAVFPVKVAAHYIGGLCEINSKIYEPFCGSGTTLIAAEQLGRTCYGMEISPQYCDVIVKRWENLTGEKATLQGSK
jgi:DNA modification methylase